MSSALVADVDENTLLIGAVSHKTSLQENTVRTTVKKHNLCLLMYYLNCVNACISAKDLDTSVTNHEEFSNDMDDNLKGRIVFLAQKYNPGTLGGVFILAPVQFEPTMELSNAFYRRTTEMKFFGAAISTSEAILVDGEKKEVSDVMVYTRSWLNRNYWIPYNAEKNNWKIKGDTSKQSTPLKVHYGDYPVCDLKSLAGPACGLVSGTCFCGCGAICSVCFPEKKKYFIGLAIGCVIFCVLFTLFVCYQLTVVKVNNYYIY